MTGSRPCRRVTTRCGAIFDYAEKQDRLTEVLAELESPDVWNEPERAQALGREQARLEETVQPLAHAEKWLGDAEELLALAEEDAEIAGELDNDLAGFEAAAEQLEFRRMFAGEFDDNNCFVDIQSGAGGTEAQDWAEMLMRMYLRWCDNRGFKTEILDRADGDVAGIKGVSFAVTGSYAYGLLRTESGIHRLVRKSPFDASGGRHTSFASVFITPEVDDDIDIEVNMADVRVDTYRASGAGGQHINKTDSAVRMTHEPTGIVVASQSQRSQHQNRDRVLKMLKAKLYELEVAKRSAEKQKLEDSKTDIGWGHQIRSYVLDQSRIKDLRTGVEIANTKGVLDGDLDPFIEASLKQGL